MLFSRKNIWAVANIICWGTQVDASSHRRRRDEAPPPSTGGQTDVYFPTTWQLPPIWPMGVNQTFNYTVNIDVPSSDSDGRILPLLLLWTNTSTAAPMTNNTWEVFEINPCKSLAPHHLGRDKANV